MDTSKNIEPERFARAMWTLIADPADEIGVAVVAYFGAREALDRITYLAKESSRFAQGLAEDAIRQAFAPLELPRSVSRIEGWVSRYRHANLQMELDWLAQLKGHVLIPADTAWVEELNQLDLPPLALWVLGDPGGMRCASIAGAASLVGARAATPYGVSIAGEMGFELCQGGAWVISGGAYGIDAAAHRGAVAANGQTISVQAGGLGELYPAMNASIFADILQSGGVILSEQPCSGRPAKRMFLLRNRLVAALGKATVVVEAGARSGALSTANHALEQGKIVAAVPGSVNSAQSEGCHRLIREGATLVTDAEQVLELIRPLCPQREKTAPESAHEQSFFFGLTAPAAKTWDSLPVKSWSSLEQVARAAGLGLAATRQELGIFELQGKVVSREGRFRRVD